MNEERQLESLSYSEVVERWREERELLSTVQSYTARKSAQKALLFAPVFGEKDIRHVRAQDVIGALIDLAQHGGRRGSGLSSTTLRAAHLAGTQAFNWAIQNGLADTNPFIKVRRPREERRQSQYLMPTQASALVAKATDQMRACLWEGRIQQASFRLATCIAMATGMRRGEIFALTWADVNELSLRIAVSKAVKADGSLGEPKSASSVRSVAIGVNLMNLLDEVRDEHASRTSCRDGHHLEPIICDKAGRMANMSTFEHWWRKWADDLGHEGLRFHDLRHSHATILIASGVDVKTVQTRLGHSSAQVTMSIYAHAIPQSDSMAAAALDSELFG